MARKYRIKEWYSSRGGRFWAMLADAINTLAKFANGVTTAHPLADWDTGRSVGIAHARPDGATSIAVADVDCAVVLGDATEGAEAADATPILFDDDSDKPYRLYAMTRAAYYHGGDKKLYGYARALTFDAWGHLQSIGAETRVELDDAGPCT